jgi:hypothetical protein
MPAFSVLGALAGAARCSYRSLRKSVRDLDEVTLDFVEDELMPGTRDGSGRTCTALMRWIILGALELEVVELRDDLVGDCDSCHGLSHRGLRETCVGVRSHDGGVVLDNNTNPASFHPAARFARRESVRSDTQSCSVPWLVVREALWEIGKVIDPRTEKCSPPPASDQTDLFITFR